MKNGTIKFYGPHDLSSGWHLQNAELFLQHWSENIRDPAVNTILELYNIKRYFDADMRLEQWTDTQVAEFKEKCKQIPEIMGRFFSTVSDANLEALYQEIDRDYTGDFWKLICDYKVYQHISPETLERLMDCGDHIVWSILRQRTLSTHFGAVIADHLTRSRHTAERLISHFLAEHEPDSDPLYFPAEFTQEMRDKLLADYVEWDDAHINMLQLLEQAQSSKEFPLSDRLRLKARRKKEALLEKMFSNSPGMSYGAKVTFTSIPDGSVQVSDQEHIISYSYSLEWLEENQDYPTLLNNFIYLFRFVDRCFRCTFVSYHSELGIFERFLGVKGKKDYQKGVSFNTKQMATLLQMTAYDRELQRLNIRLEDIFKWFFEDYLKQEFGAAGFTYTPPSPGTTYAEKCKLLAIAIDGALKQYRLFCEDGDVDRELLEMSSGHIVFGDLSSTLSHKYAYSNSKALDQEMFLLFSDQSMMHCIEKVGSKYPTLPHLLLSEHIKPEDFAHYQQNNLDWLIQRGVIFTADDGYLRLNQAKAVVLKDLFYHEVICPAYYELALQRQVESLAAAGEIRYENTLFSEPEQDYLNYVLNKSEFSNGLDLRNKYSHDTCSLDENIQAQDYVELQKIMVLILIKINEEFCQKEQH